MSRTKRITGAALLLALAGLGGAPLAAAPADEDLDFYEFQSLLVAVQRLDHLAMLEPPQGGAGMYLVLGDRYGLVRIYHLTHGHSAQKWESKQLDGLVDEVRAADLDGDGYEDVFTASSSAGMFYVWDAVTFESRFESLTTDFQLIHTYTFGNVDEDPQTEIIINADKRIYYLDGLTFNREWTSLQEYEATRMACGDVDGDRRNEIVLNTGQVIDSRSGDVEWEDEVFGSRIELLDMDGDGLPEVLTESDDAPMKVFDVDHRKEKHLQ
jgi:hypothetical protein